jgi:hypothetical protein
VRVSEGESVSVKVLTVAAKGATRSFFFKE